LVPSSASPFRIALARGTRIGNAAKAKRAEGGPPIAKLFALAQLAALTGLPKSRISEILNGRRSRSLKMIRVLHEKLRIPADILISPEGPSTSS
jgi:transcriptional regulator with XRE-family HTH domain